MYLQKLDVRKIIVFLISLARIEWYSVAKYNSLLIAFDTNESQLRSDFNKDSD